MPLSSRQLAELVRIYQETVGAIASEVADRIAAVWDDLPGYDAADVGAFADAVGPILETAKASTVRTTSGYLARVTGTPTVAILPDMVPAIAPDPRTPFTAMWRVLNNTSGNPAFAAMTETELRAAAFAAGRSAAMQGGVDHVHRSSRQTGDSWEKRTTAQVVGWRRVLTGTSCEWCGIVSTQRYRSAMSADFGHHGCDCGVAPIVGDRDPGRFINKELADNLDPTISRRIDVNRYADTQTKAATNAMAKRDAARAELATETDPERRIRLEGRVRRWDDKAASYRAKAARSAADLEPPAPGPGHTGYIDEQGRPAPRPGRTKVDA